MATDTKEKTGTPKSLKIWGHQFAIKKKKNPKWYDGTTTSIVLGLFSPDTQEIFLSNNEIKTGTREVETLIHEILHGVCYFSNLFADMEKKRELEEKVVDTLANGLTLIMKDNPDLVSYFKEKLYE